MNARILIALAGIAILGAGTDNVLFCEARGGSVNVQTSSSNRLKGTFTMHMVCADLAGDTALETEVTGSFDAAGGTVVMPG